MDTSATDHPESGRPLRPAMLSRRGFVGGAAAVAASLLALHDRGALAAITAAAGQGAAPALKPPIVGLVDRDGTASGFAYRRYAQHFGAFVGRVDHSALHPAPGRFDFRAVDAMLDEAADLDLVVRLRVYLGIQVADGQARPASPLWLRDRVGTITVADPNWVGPGPTPRFWHPDYRRHYRDLLTALADRYDDDPRLGEVHATPGALIGGETMIQRYDNRAALEAAGYPGWRADRDLQLGFLADYATTFARTGLYYPLNGYQRLDANLSVTTTLDIVDAALTLLGGRLRPANNSLVADDRLDEQRGGAYRAIYDEIRDTWTPAGISCQIQTDNPRNIATKGRGTGTLDGTIRYAATVIGAASVELPSTYPQHLGDLKRWAALFPDPHPQDPYQPVLPPGRRALTTPSPTDPAYCRGRITGELFGDGHPTTRGWAFTANPARVDEVARCLDRLDWDHTQSATTITIADTVLPAGWNSLVPGPGATVAEIQGWCGGVLEGEGSTDGLAWDLTVRYATGATLPDRQATARDKTTWCAAQWRRLGARPVTTTGGDDDLQTWRVELAPADFEIAQAIGHYTSWGRVPGGRR